MSAKKQLSREQLAELKEIFKMFDKEDTGKIDTKSLGTMLRKMGKKLTESDIKKMLREVDKDSNGFIDFPEFVQAMYAHMVSGDSQDSELQDAFDIFDVDGDGHITFHELKSVLASMGERMSDAEIEDMLFEADADGNGVIDFSEFTTLMESVNNR